MAELLFYRSQKETPDPNAFESYFEWTNGAPLNSYSNQFVFSTKIPFRSLSDCGGTGKAIFRYILHDLDTDSAIVADDIELIIYGCGDGYCTSESELENSFNCLISEISNYLPDARINVFSLIPRRCVDYGHPQRIHIVNTLLANLCPKYKNCFMINIFSNFCHI